MTRIKFRHDSYKLHKLKSINGIHSMEGKANYEQKDEGIKCVLL